MNNRLLFIGPEVIHQYLKEEYTFWDFQVPVKTIEEFSNELNKSNPKFSTETSCLVFYGDLFYDSLNKNLAPHQIEHTKKNFANVVAYLTPFVNVQILLPETENNTEKETFKKEISKYIEDAQRELEKTDEENNYFGSPFQFIDYNDFDTDLINNMKQYIDDEYNYYEVVQNLVSLYDENMESEEIEDEEDEELDEDIEINEDNEIIPASNGDGVVISFTSSKGGVGKSTISTLVASYLDKNTNKKIALIDMDTEASQLGFILGGSLSPTMTNAYQAWEENNHNLSEDDIKESLIRVSCFSNKVDVFLSSDPKFTKIIPVNFYAHFIQKLRELYDVIILDTSTKYVGELSSNVVYPISDFIFVIRDMGDASNGIFYLLSHLTEPKAEDSLEINKDKIAIIINQIISGEDIDFEELEKLTLGVNIVSMIPSHQRLVHSASKNKQLNTVLDNQHFNNSIAMIVNHLKEKEVL